MSQLPASLYTAIQVRELDRTAIEGHAIPGIVLMKRAGRATLSALLARWPAPEKITVYCGAGNNGGDGYIVAALAWAKGLNVEVIQVAPAEKLVGDARRAYEFAQREGVAITSLAVAHLPSAGVIVDALLGTGLEGEVRKSVAQVIDGINTSGLPVVAVDIPSGLCANTGRVLGCAVAAQLTVTFIGLKRGLLTGRGPVFSGELVFDDLGVPESIYQEVEADCQLSQWSSLSSSIALRPKDAHKGLYGHVMVIGGDLGFGGAVAMAAEAALSVGAGLVSVATRAEHVAPILSRTPEVMAIGVASGQELEPHLDRPTVLVIGPGLGRSPWSEQMLQKALASSLPMVLDADALNMLADRRIGNGADYSQAVFTPHPGEAARLLGMANIEVQNDRFTAVAALREKYHSTVLLKGVGTLIASGDRGLRLCPYGNPGMASGGQGDVLSGVIGGLLAQGLPLSQATEVGACLHALAGDDAAAIGQVGLRATDLMPYLRQRANGYCGGLT